MAPKGRARLDVRNLQAGKFQHNRRKVSPADTQSCGGRVELFWQLSRDGGNHIGKIPALGKRGTGGR